MESDLILKGLRAIQRIVSSFYRAYLSVLQKEISIDSNQCLTFHHKSWFHPPHLEQTQSNAWCCQVLVKHFSVEGPLLKWVHLPTVNA